MADTTETFETMESQAETGAEKATGNDKFNETEERNIQELVAKLYDSEGHYIEGDSDEAVKEAKIELRRKCDTSRMEEIGEGFRPDELAKILINRGKPKVDGEMTNEEGEKVQVNANEVFSTTIGRRDNEPPLEIRTEKSTLKIVWREARLMAEIKTASGGTVEQELTIGEGNTIRRQDENDILVDVSEAGKDRLTIKASQTGSQGLRTLNLSEGAF